MSQTLDQPPIPAKYRDDKSKLNRTIAALVDRGIDIATAASLKDCGYTLASLLQLDDAALAGLSVPAQAIAQMRKDRPPIPADTLTALFIANRFSCCVCKSRSHSVIVHHIEEWSVSHSHAPENLAVLCLEHHDAAHRRGGLTQNLTLDLIRTFKREWEEQVRRQPFGPNDTSDTPAAADALMRVGEVQRQTFYARLSDQEIEQALGRLRQARFLTGFPTKEEALRLADKVEQAELAGGSREVRARALAWCARILSSGDTLERAKALAAQSRALTPTAEGELADAFILANSDRQAALAKLGAIDSPAARSAALRVVVNSEDPAAALAWAKRAGLGAEAFDPDGKYTFFLAALLTEQWDLLLCAPGAITDGDLEDNAALLHVLAMAHLLSAVPARMRALVILQIPPEPVEAPLSSEPDQMIARKEAQALFARLAEYCCQVGVEAGANIAGDYALWLELRHPETHLTGMTHLRDSMRDPLQSLRRLNLALKFGLKPDIAAIERRLDQSIAFSGTGTADEAFARYALIFAQKSPRDAALYIAKYREQLYAHLQKLPIMGIEVEILARSGQIDAARERLAEAAAEGLGTTEQKALNIIIAEVVGEDPLAERRALYEQTGELHALRNLTEALEESDLFEELLPNAEQLFSQTHDVADCELMARALDQLGRYGELFAFLSAQTSLVQQSVNLRALWAWTLWREGRFVQASAALDSLVAHRTTASHRALRVNLAISSGNWSSLNLYCEEIWADRAAVSVQELLQAAELANAIGNSHAQALVRAATEAAPDDPGILVKAYSLATEGGWEQDALVAGWIERAAAMSGEDGPIKKMSLKEVLDRKPAWDKHASDVATKLNNGSLPAFIAAELLHRSLMDLTVLPALANPGEADVRRRSVVYAFSGARQPLTFRAGATIALELGALFTLARLGLLDLVLARFPILIPHSTLGWLFKERAKAFFHQPSRIKDAQFLKQLVQSHVVGVITESATPDSSLLRDVDKELAEMQVLAKNQSEAGMATVVVRSPPIYRLGSLMEEEADLSVYQSRLVSCGAFVDALKAKGVLTASEEARARAYLRTQEKAWPAEPTVDAGTQFLLDGLSISHLRAAGVLGKLKTAGLKVLISSSDDDEANAFIAMASLSEQQLATIECIRAGLESGLVDGRVRAVRPLRAEEDQEFQSHPSYSILALSETADALLMDDRFLNRYSNMIYEGHATPVITTLDLLDHLVGEGVLTEADRSIHRTTLRQCGYQIIPVGEAELRLHLMAAPVEADGLVETAELKAIREMLLRARMTKLVQLPQELPALQETQTTLVHLISEVWSSASNEAEAVARADWLLRLSDIRGWASAAEPGQARNFAVFGYAQYALHLSTAPIEGDKELRERYFAWVSDRVLNQIAQSEPEIHDWILDQIKQLVVDGVTDAMRDEP